MESKHVHQFKYIIEDLKVNPDKPQECFQNLSLFEKVLSVPGNQKFIDICIQYGSDFFQVCESVFVESANNFFFFSQKNDKRKYPLHYAVHSLCAENLTALMKSAEDSAHKTHRDIVFSTIVNEKFEGGNNYLHFLIEKLNTDNYDHVSIMIKQMVGHKCSVNALNDNLESPFYSLLRKLAKINAGNDLAAFVLDHSNADLFSHRSDQIAKLLESQNLSHRIGVREEEVMDGKYFIRVLEDWNEKKFVDEFESHKLRATNGDYKSDLARLLEAAVVRNLVKAADLLLLNGADVNGCEKRQSLTPAFYACCFGNFQVLKRLLAESSFNFHCLVSSRNVLHQICMATSVHEVDREKCFDLIINDPRCTMKVINGLDGIGQAPLFYASHFGFDEMAKELLRRGAFVGHESIVNNISKDVLSEFLDECIKSSSDIRSKTCEIHVDYRFLVPPTVNDPVHEEILQVRRIAESEQLGELVLHPVISSFLHLKWKKVNWIVYFNLLVYFAFMIFLGSFIIKYFHDPIYTMYDKKSGVEIGFRSTDDIASRNIINLFPNRMGEDVSTPIAYGAGITPPPASAFGKLEPITTTPGFTSTTPQTTTTTPDFTSTTSQTTTTTPRPFQPPNMWSKIFGFGSSSSKRSKRSTDEISDSDEWERRLDDYFAQHAWSYRFCVFGFVLMVIYEVLQCCFSWRKYFLKWSNWLDMSLIGISFVVLFYSLHLPSTSFKKIQATMILIMAAQSIQLIATVSLLSMSLHMAIFKRVCLTFLKTISLYLILIIAFAMSFYTLSDNAEKKASDQLKFGFGDKGDDDDEDSFSNPFISIITTVRMMLSDFDKIKIDSDDVFQGIIFLLFVTLITVVLFNLLNALAISDTAEILKDAEFVDIKKRISILFAYERIFMRLQFCFTNIFPQMTSIMIRPNVDRRIFSTSKLGNGDDVRIPMCKDKKLHSILGSNVMDYWDAKNRKTKMMGAKTFGKIVKFVANGQKK